MHTDSGGVFFGLGAHLNHAAAERLQEDIRHQFNLAARGGLKIILLADQHPQVILGNVGITHDIFLVEFTPGRGIALTAVAVGGDIAAGPGAGILNLMI